MNKTEKNQIIDDLVEKISSSPTFYLADISGLTVEKTSQLRRLCFNKGIGIRVAKNTLIKKALERISAKSGGSADEYVQLYDVLKGSSSIMFSEVGNLPAKVIQEFRKSNEKPILKGAYINASIYVGDNQLTMLAALKSKNEIIADVIALLQSPAKNVIGALQSGKNKLAGIVKTLSEKHE